MTTSDSPVDLLERMQLLASRRGSWIEVGLLLNKIEADGVWKKDAHTYTQWLEKFSSQNKIAASTLWRYKATVRLGMNLFYMNNDTPDEDISNTLENYSPETLELLGKIEKKASFEVYQPFADAVVNKSITRKELRDAWLLIRTKPEQSMSSERSRLNSPAFQRLKFETRKSLLANLLRHTPQWLTDLGCVQNHKIFFDFNFKTIENIEIHLDAVIVVLIDNSSYATHAFISETDYQHHNNVSLIMGYCERTWLLKETVGSVERITDSRGIVEKPPFGLGILECTPNGCNIALPSNSIKDVDKASVMASNLVVKFLSSKN